MVQNPKPLIFGQAKCPVYLRLPWKGLRTAEMVLQAVKKEVNPAFPACEVRVVYSSRTAVHGSLKDVIPTLQKSNVICLSAKVGIGMWGKRLSAWRTRLNSIYHQTYWTSHLKPSLSQQ